MAFTQAQIITATELNNVNNSWQTFIQQWGDGYGDHSGVSPWFYIRGSSGKFGKIRLANGGWFPRVRGYMNKKDSATGASYTVWTVGDLTKSQSAWEYEFYVQNYGPGWYQLGGSGSRAHHTVTFWCGQKDCQQGKLLTYWDNPQNSSNRIPGTSFTTSVLNSGLAGTIN
ncbi:hypothetical protein [Sphaerochaeta globosa]|uniref:Uncharacterized protein n=1 Tax=Sphaerochaeta globosa (strain ATCC BAA-1886 / DSM 22777 / Buddy) TaxID=158189 RepID=F0RWR9_SPHGB|nr:hypothetical protein [Sphaerochaeta globosa]ADY13700.1 hypothetical protein SpiBuddy_1876 [Sphaerochaeta globosa str. Buddy]